MENKIIFVNATSATMGGSLTILNQFIENINILKDKDKKYYIFTPLDCDIKSTEYFEIIPVKAKSYKDRIIWDLCGMNKWSKTKKIYPDLILSLQNTGVRFGNVKQIIYLHQSIPYAKESNWNPLKKDERKMWFYKYLYKIWIDLSIKKDHKIVVQTNWMKDALIEDGYNEENIIISKPNISNIDVEEVETIQLEEKKCYFFYPAADYKYKNHDVIIEALNLIKQEDINLLKRIRVIFTLSKESKHYYKVNKYKLDENIQFLSSLEYKEVLRFYKSSNVVIFPSYIETLGLPLLEASMFGKKILVADCCYSREVMEGYNNVKFIEYKDAITWANAIKESINNDYDNETSRKIDYNAGWDDFNKVLYDILS